MPGAAGAGDIAAVVTGGEDYNLTGDPFIARYHHRDQGALRLAVKDVFDLEGERTGGGSRYLSSRVPPAVRDATCVAMAKRAGATVVGKTTMVELALGAHGINLWCGTPQNPCDAGLCPGGSSSGSAVAVALGEADLGLGTDTAGSVRIPAACCGVFGLKTTYGRVARSGVMPLARSLDTVGVISASASGLGTWLAMMGMDAEVGDRRTTRRVALVQTGVRVQIMEPLERSLESAGFVVERLAGEAIGWKDAAEAANMVLEAEAGEEYGWLIEQGADEIDPGVMRRLRRGSQSDRDDVGRARRVVGEFARRCAEVFRRYEMLACATLEDRPPRLQDGPGWGFNASTIQANAVGVPAVAIPLRGRRVGDWPISLQLLSPWDGEAALVAAAEELEGAGIAGSEAPPR